MSEEQITDLQTFQSGLSVAEHNELAAPYNKFWQDTIDLVKESEALEVTSDQDVEAMAKAREIRLKLKQIRVSADKVRKSQKEGVVLKGQAIDGMFKIVKAMIVPAENRLQEMEDFIRIAEEKRIALLVDTRKAELQSLGVSSEHFNLGAMSTEAYDQLLTSSKLAWKAKRDAEAAEQKRIDDERIASEKREAEEREKQKARQAEVEAENERLRKEAEEREAIAEKERIEREAKEAKERAAREAEEAKRKAAEAAAEAERQKERDRIEAEKQKAEAEAQALRDAEAKRIQEEKKAKAEAERKAQADELARVAAEKEAEQAKLAAPDREKLQILTDALCKLQLPSVSSEVALKAVHQTKGIIINAVKVLRAAIEDLEPEGETDNE